MGVNTTDLIKGVPDWNQIINENNAILSNAIDANSNKIGDLTGLTYANLADNVKKNTTDLSEKVQQKGINIKYPPLTSNLQGAKGDGTTYDSNAINLLLDWAYANGYTNIYFPTGTYILDKYLRQYDNMKFFGDGQGLTILKTVGINTHAVRSYPTDTYIKNLSITGMTIQGTATTSSLEGDNQTYVASGHAIVYTMVENVCFYDVEVCWFYSFGYQIMDCLNVYINKCVTHNTGRDGFNATGCKKVTVDDNIFRNIGDDPIACHRTTSHKTIMYTPEGGVCDKIWTSSTSYNENDYVVSNEILYKCVTAGISGTTAPSGVIDFVDGSVTWAFINTNKAEEIIISNNILEHTGAISTVGGETVIIHDNIIKWCRGVAIQIGGSSDGANIGNAVNIDIHDNIIKNLFDISEQTAVIIANYHNINVGTFSSGNFILPEDNLNNSFYAFNVSFHDNTIMQEAKAGTYTSSWNGNIDNKFALTDNKLYGVTLKGNLNSISIKDNLFYRVKIGIKRTQSDDAAWNIPRGQLDKLFIEGNKFIRGNLGIDIGSADSDAIMYITGKIKNNIFDLDPYFESIYRNTDGTWITHDYSPRALFLYRIQGLIIEDNIFKNLEHLAVGTETGLIFRNNTVYAGTVMLEELYVAGRCWRSCKKILVDGNPASSSYGNILAIQQKESTAIPTSGLYLKGDYIRNQVPSIGNPKGWYCTVTGTPGTFTSEGNL